MCERERDRDRDGDQKEHNNQKIGRRTDISWVREIPSNELTAAVDACIK